MTVQIITALGPWPSSMSGDEYARTQVTRTTDPTRVAEALVTTGTAPDGPKIVVMGDDEEPMHYLDIGQALAVAHRIIELAVVTPRGADQ